MLISNSCKNNPANKYYMYRYRTYPSLLLTAPHLLTIITKRVGEAEDTQQRKILEYFKYHLQHEVLLNNLMLVKNKINKNTQKIKNKTKNYMKQFRMFTFLWHVDFILNVVLTNG